MIKYIADLALRNGFAKAKVVVAGKRKVIIFHEYKHTARTEIRSVNTQIQIQVYSLAPAYAKSQH